MSGDANGNAEGASVATTLTQTTPTMTDIERRIIAAQGYVELGLFAEAREELGALPEGLQERTDVVEVTVLCLMGEQRWEEALAFARRLCASEPEEPGGFIHAAYCLHEMGRTREAVDVLVRGPASLQGKAVFFYNMGCYRAKLGEVDAAVEMLQKAFSKDESLRRSARRDPDLDALRPRLEAI
jgi:tetratricopeptide (TPR) repeat protein